MSLEANRLNINAARLQIEIVRRTGDSAQADALAAEFERVWPVVGLKKAEESASAKTGWRAKFDRALHLVSVGRDSEADALLEECGEVEDAVFRLYRARRRSGERRLADLEAARRIGDGWRVGIALAEYHLAADDLEAAEAVLADYIKRFPRRNPLEILYAETLQRLGKNRECIEFLKCVKILPSEFGRNAIKFWQEAWKALGDGKMAETYPENLGAGKPFPDKDE